MKGLNRSCFLLGLLVIFAAIPPAFAQVDRAKGTLRGTVADLTGAVIAGATVAVTNPSTGATKTAKTCAGGSYQVTGLAPGLYEVTVKGDGFAKKISKEIQVRAGRTVFYDAYMRASGTVTIEVSWDEVPSALQPGARLLYIDRREPELSGDPKKEIAPSR